MGADSQFLSCYSPVPPPPPCPGTRLSSTSIVFSCWLCAKVNCASGGKWRRICVVCERTIGTVHPDTGDAGECVESSYDRLQVAWLSYK